MQCFNCYWNSFYKAKWTCSLLTNPHLKARPWRLQQLLWLRQRLGRVGLVARGCPMGNNAGGKKMGGKPVKMSKIIIKKRESELKEMMLKCVKILFGGEEEQYLADQALCKIRFLYA